MEKTKSNRRVPGATIAIITLSILLLVSVGVGIALAYFSSTTNVVGNVTLGDPVTISITQAGASVESLTFSDAALPGDVFDQPIGISSPANMTTALVRAKITITNDDGATTNVTAETTDSWVKGEDNYHYYKGTVGASQNIDFVTKITIPTTLTNADANKTFNIDVVVETIQQANNAANTVWNTAPADWLETYSPVPATTNLTLDEGESLSNDENPVNFGDDNLDIDTRRLKF